MFSNLQIIILIDKHFFINKYNLSIFIVFLAYFKDLTK